MYDLYIINFYTRKIQIIRIIIKDLKITNLNQQH